MMLILKFRITENLCFCNSFPIIFGYLNLFMKKLILLVLPLMLVGCGSPETVEIETEVVGTETTEVEMGEDRLRLTMEEIAKHADKESCYSAIDGKVYDLTEFMSKHPGGAGNILKICGKDGSEAFSGQHEGSAQAKAALPDYMIGELED